MVVSHKGSFYMGKGGCKIPSGTVNTGQLIEGRVLPGSVPCGFVKRVIGFLHFPLEFQGKASW